MLAGSNDRAVAVTGLGVVTAVGTGVEAFFAGLCRGETAIADLAEADLFDPQPHRTSLAAVVAMGHDRVDGRADRFAWMATEEAVAQAFGGDPSQKVLQSPRAGLFFGSSNGGLLETERFMARMIAFERPRHIAKLGSQQQNGPGDHIARKLGICGPVVSFSSACSSSTMALGAALDAIRSGEVDVAIAGGADELSQLTYAGFNALRAIDKAPTRPFRADRAGQSLGEGAGVLVLESVAHADERGARPLALLRGAASSCDAHHMSAPAPDGVGARRALAAALVDAEVAPEAVDFVNVHGTGTPQNDVAEWRALTEVFGERAASVPWTATKSVVGHLLGACGAVEAIATVLSLQRELVPPTAGDGPIDPELPCDLVLGAPRSVPGVRLGVSTNLAFGGANSAVVLEAVR